MAEADWLPSYISPNVLCKQRLAEEKSHRLWVWLGGAVDYYAHAIRKPKSYSYKGLLLQHCIRHMIVCAPDHSCHTKKKKKKLSCQLIGTPSISRMEVQPCVSYESCGGVSVMQDGLCQQLALESLVDVLRAIMFHSLCACVHFSYVNFNLPDAPQQLLSLSAAFAFTCICSIIEEMLQLFLERSDGVHTLMPLLLILDSGK